MLQSFQHLMVNFSAVCGGDDPSFFGFPTWYKYLSPKDVNGVCTPDFVFPDKLPLVGLAIVDILLRIAALVAIAYVVYGGIRYTTSQGDPQATSSARETIIGALAGLVIATVAAAVVSFIGSQLSK